MSAEDTVGKALARVVAYAILTAVVLGIIQWFFTQGVPMIAEATGLRRRSQVKGRLLLHKHSPRFLRGSLLCFHTLLSPLVLYLV